MKPKPKPKAEPGLCVRLPFTPSEKEEVLHFRRVNQKHMGRWVADLVLIDVRAHK